MQPARQLCQHGCIFYHCVRFIYSDFDAKYYHYVILFVYLLQKEDRYFLYKY
jgi:hypothetical protein